MPFKAKLFAWSEPSTPLDTSHRVGPEAIAPTLNSTVALSTRCVTKACGVAVPKVLSLMRPVPVVAMLCVVGFVPKSTAASAAAVVAGVI